MLTIISGPPNTFKSVAARGAMAMNLRHGHRGLYIDTDGCHLFEVFKREMTEGVPARVDRFSGMTFPGVAPSEVVMAAVEQSAKDGVKLVVIDQVNNIFIGRKPQDGFFHPLVLADFMKQLEDHLLRHPEQRIIAIITTNRRYRP